MAFNIKDNVAIVTGSSRGIGYHIAEALASLGVNLVITARKQAVCDEVASKLAKTYEVDCIGIQADVSQEDQAQAVVKGAIDRFGAVDILVNNAGITKDNILLRLSDQDWNEVIQTNLNSVFYFSKAVLRPMMKKRRGRIVNITSVVGLMGNNGQANYAASKAGVIGFTKSLAKEYASKGITCNAVAPGFIQTDMIESLPDDYIDNIISSIPQKRFGKAEDVANLVTFLASDLAGYITGQVISVDGGMLM